MTNRNIAGSLFAAAILAAIGGNIAGSGLSLMPRMPSAPSPAKRSRGFQRYIPRPELKEAAQAKAPRRALVKALGRRQTLKHIKLQRAQLASIRAAAAAAA